MEGFIMEVDFARNDLINHLNNLDEWTKPEKVRGKWVLLS